MTAEQVLMVLVAVGVVVFVLITWLLPSIDVDEIQRPPADVDENEAEYWPCTWCGGDGYAECDDPEQCCDPRCDGVIGPCRSCEGRGYDQVVW